MNQVGVYERISNILHLIQKRPSTYREIKDKLKKLAELRGVEFGYSLRTLQRDLAEVRELHGIVIRCNKRSKLYQIVEEESNLINQHLQESIDLIHTFQLSKGVEEFIFFDDRTSRGTEHLHSLVNAIKKQLVIQFYHKLNFENNPTLRKIRPLALKEVKKSWYLIGWNEKNELRNYGLDRIENLEISAEKFEKGTELNLKNHYRHIFGIFNDPKVSVEEVVLFFVPQRGNYIKSKPLHPTQRTLEDSEGGLTIALDVKINPELLSEILSYGEQVQVLRPATLKTQLRELLEKMLSNIT
jgi:predicted DNA-binding transcriptional regulator YafY